jgi:hypothetical protein
LTNTNAGVFAVSYTVSFTVSATNVVVYSAIFVNGTQQTKMSSRSYGANTTYVFNINGTGLLTLAASSVVEIRIACNRTITITIGFVDLNLNIVDVT